MSKQKTEKNGVPSNRLTLTSEDATVTSDETTTLYYQPSPSNIPIYSEGTWVELHIDQEVRVVVGSNNDSIRIEPISQEVGANK